MLVYTIYLTYLSNLHIYGNNGFWLLSKSNKNALLKIMILLICKPEFNIGEWLSIVLENKKTKHNTIGEGIFKQKLCVGVPWCENKSMGGYGYLFSDFITF